MQAQEIFLYSKSIFKAEIVSDSTAQSCTLRVSRKNFSKAIIHLVQLIKENKISKTNPNEVNIGNRTLSTFYGSYTLNMHSYDTNNLDMHKIDLGDKNFLYYNPKTFEDDLCLANRIVQAWNAVRLASVGTSYSLVKV